MNLNNIESLEKYDYHDFFPFGEFRQDQEETVIKIKESMKSKENFLFIAPNGTGKTITSLCGVLPLAYKRNLKVIYLCRTNTQNARIIKELKEISNCTKFKSSSFVLNALSLRGRNEMCLSKALKEKKLNSEDARDLCDRMRKNQACEFFLQLLKSQNGSVYSYNIAPQLFGKPVDAEEILSFCVEKGMCPYYFSKNLINSAKIIVCNYQWILNPNIRKWFLRDVGISLENCIQIFDECHNLIDVCTDVNSNKITIMSLQLCKKDLNYLQEEKFNYLKGKIQDLINSLIDHLETKKKKLKSGEKKIEPYSLLKKIYQKMGIDNDQKFNLFLKNILGISESIELKKEEKNNFSKNHITAFYKFWHKWIECCNSDSYFFCYNVENRKDKKIIELEINALDPREISIPLLKNSYATVHLSGTVTSRVYTSLMGLEKCGKEYNIKEIGSPFKKENFRSIITLGVDTARDNRTPEMYKKINKKIEEVLNCTPANIGIFCASYKVLKGVLDNGIQSIVKRSRKKLFIENRGVSASENAKLISDYKAMGNPPNKGAVLLGVCGGRNSEGEDYPGNYMNSVIIVGVPYLRPTPKVKAKMKYYGKVFPGQGWNYGYLFPAFLKANQASGRPIRKKDDKGGIIFMDWRFIQKRNWISNWVRKNIKVTKDIEGAISNNLKNLWN